MGAADRRRSPTPGRRCVWRRTSTASATRRTPAPATFERNLERSPSWTRSWGSVASRSSSTTGAGSSGWHGPASIPDRVSALVISDTGFFADGKWHGMAEAMRSEQGEELVGGARSRRLRRPAARGRRRVRRGGPRRLLAPVRAGARARGNARVLPLDGLRKARALRGQAGPRSASRRCFSGVPRTSSRRSPARIASRGRSRVPGSSPSRAPATSYMTRSPAPPPPRWSGSSRVRPSRSP